MWAEMTNKSGKQVRVLNNDEIPIEESDPGKIGGYIGAFIGIIVFFIFRLNSIYTAILYLCLIEVFKWLFEEYYKLTGKKKAEETQIRQLLDDARYLSNKSVLEIDEEDLKKELGEKYSVNRFEEGWQVEFKNRKYDITDQREDSFCVKAEESEKIDVAALTKDIGYLTFHIQKLCDNEINYEDKMFEEPKFEPTAKDHVILIAKIVIIIFVVYTVFFPGKNSLDIDNVKRNYLTGYPKITIGEVLETHTSNGKWSSEDDDGTQLVTFKGWLKSDGSKKKLEIRFHVFEDGSFQADEMILDGEELDYLDQSIVWSYLYSK